MLSQMVIRNGTIITMSSAKWAEEPWAVAVDNGKIAAIGRDGDIEPLISVGTQVIDLQGRPLLPGFIDPHVHFMATAVGLMRANLKDCQCLADVFDVVASEVHRLGNGEIIWSHGFNLFALTEERYPTIDELDKVAPENPVFIVDRSHHAMVVNRRAFDLLNLPTDTSGICQAEGLAKPTGLMLAQANTLAKHRLSNLVPDEVKGEGLHRASDIALRVGVTSIDSLDGGPWSGDRDIELILGELPKLPIKVSLCYQTPDISQVMRLGLPRIGGCLWVDGAPVQGTAAFLEPYCDDPNNRGVLYYTQEETNEWVWRAHRSGIQTCRHAIGDAAIEQMLVALQRALRDWPRQDHRHRIEHFMFPTQRQIEEAARMGIAIVAAPIGVRGVSQATRERQMAFMSRTLGRERLEQRDRLHTLMNQGLLVAGGSDSDCSPLDPISELHFVVNSLAPAERLAIFDALSLFTVNAAKVDFQEGRKGIIKPGLDADFVVLSNNPFTVKPTALEQIRVEMTIVDGKVVFAGDFSTTG